VWALLRYRLGWSVQRPKRRAAERWPAIKQRPTAQSLPGLPRRVRAQPDPNVGRTWAPKGQPPTLTHPFNWKKASMAAAICYGVRGGGCQLCFHVRAGNYDTDRLIQVLGELRCFLGGEKATLLWDGLPAHRSAAMRAWLNTQRSWLVVERLPAYAPELNPVEGLWSSLKAVELANLTAPTLAEVIQQAHQGIERVRQPRTWPARSCGTPACRSHDPSTQHPSPCRKARGLRKPSSTTRAATRCGAARWRCLAGCWRRAGCRTW
jgi:DDE superfamily endonuclease